MIDYELLSKWLDARWNPEIRQHVLLKLWARYGNKEEPTGDIDGLHALAFTIARNAFRDLFRAEKRYREVLSKFSAPTFHTSTPMDYAAARETLDRIPSHVSYTLVMGRGTRKERFRLRQALRSAYSVNRAN